MESREAAGTQTKWGVTETAVDIEAFQLHLFWMGAGAGKKDHTSAGQQAPLEVLNLNSCSLWAHGQRCLVLATALGWPRLQAGTSRGSVSCKVVFVGQELCQNGRTAPRERVHPKAFVTRYG